MESPLIKIVDLKKEFDGNWITRGVNLEIPANKMTVIIGRSGEGKSVLLKQIVGLIKPTSGEIIVEGTDITKLNDRKLRDYYKRVGYVLVYRFMGYAFAAVLFFPSHSLCVQNADKRDVVLQSTSVARRPFPAFSHEKLFEHNRQLEAVWKNKNMLQRFYDSDTDWGLIFTVLGLHGVCIGLMYWVCMNYA